MKISRRNCLLSIGGSSIPYGNIVNDSRRFGNYNLEYLATFLESKNIRTELKYYNNSSDDKKIKAVLLHFDIVIVFVDYLNEGKISNLFKDIKRDNPNIVLIGFGSYVDNHYENLISESFDFLCLGNPMTSVYEIMDSNIDCSILSKNENIVSKGCCTNKKRSQYYDCEIIPKNDYYKLDKKTDIRYKTYVLSTRNEVCLGRCTFCLSNKGRYTYRPAALVIREIHELVKIGVRDFLINDNDFFEIWEDSINKERIIKIINGLKDIKEKITISCFAKSRTINMIEEEYLLSFKESGLYCVFIGIDAGCLHDKELYNKGSSLTEDQMALNKLDRLGIFRRIGFISVNSFSTPNTLQENYEFLIKIKSSNIYHYGKLRLLLFKGTYLYNMVKEQGLLKKNNKSIEDYNYADSKTKYIVDYLDDLFYKLESNKDFYPFISFKRKYEEAKFLKPKISEIYGKEVNALEYEEFDAIKRYFKIVFVDRDFGKADKFENNFCNAIIARCLKAKELSRELDKIIMEEKYYGISTK